MGREVPFSRDNAKNCASCTLDGLRVKQPAQVFKFSLLPVLGAISTTWYFPTHRQDPHINYKAIPCAHGTSRRLFSPSSLEEDRPAQPSSAVVAGGRPAPSSFAGVRPAPSSSTGVLHALPLSGVVIPRRRPPRSSRVALQRRGPPRVTGPQL